MRSQHGAGFFLLLLLGAASPTVATSESPPSALGTAEYHYAGPLEVTGRTQGECAGWGLEPTPSQPGQLEIRTRGGQLTVRTTWVNQSLVDADPATRYAEQSQHRVRVDPGFLHVAWDASGRARVYPFEAHRPSQSRQNFTVAFESQELRAGSLQLGQGPELPYYATAPGALARLEKGDFPSWSRRVHVDGDLVAQGQFSVYLREAELVLPDGRLERLGPWREEASPLALAPHAGKSIRYTDAFLDVRGGRLALSGDAGEALCGSELAAHVRGHLTAHRASGHAQLRETRVQFTDDLLSLEGEFDVVERGDTRPRSGNAETSVGAQASGDIRAVTADLQPLLAAPLPRMPSATLGWLGLITLVAVLAATPWGHFVGLFYARFGPERVLHHPRRQRVYEAVLSQPGVPVSRLALLLGLPLNSLTYHLRVLRRAGKVGTLRHGRTVRVLPQETMPPRPEEPPAALVLEDARMRFLAERVRQGPLLLTEVVRRVRDTFGLSQRGALHVVDRAVRWGLLVKRPSPDGKLGKALRLEPGPALAAPNP